jgi:hypothetical protein
MARPLSSQEDLRLHFERILRNISQTKDVEFLEVEEQISFDEEENSIERTLRLVYRVEPNG